MKKTDLGTALTREEQKNIKGGLPPLVDGEWVKCDDGTSIGCYQLFGGYDFDNPGNASAFCDSMGYSYVGNDPWGHTDDTCTVRA